MQRTNCVYAVFGARRWDEKSDSHAKPVHARILVSWQFRARSSEGKLSGKTCTAIREAIETPRRCTVLFRTTSQSAALIISTLARLAIKRTEASPSASVLRVDITIVIFIVSRVLLDGKVSLTVTIAL